MAAAKAVSMRTRRAGCIVATESDVGNFGAGNPDHGATPAAAVTTDRAAPCHSMLPSPRRPARRRLALLTPEDVQSLRAPSAVPPLGDYNPPLEPFLSLVFANDDLLVFDKPSGLLTVPGRDPAHGDCLERRARTAYPEARLVHRLDKDTSGLVVMARSARAQRHLGLQFERRHVAKSYIARVWGDLAGTAQAHCGVVNAPLRCDWPNRPRQIICHRHGRSALTQWHVETKERLEMTLRVRQGRDVEISSVGGVATRVRLHPETGRSHQLRVHMLALGHPILGDALYAHPRAHRAAPRLQLHAARLTLYRPSDGKRVTFEAPVPF